MDVDWKYCHVAVSIADHRGSIRRSLPPPPTTDCTTHERWRPPPRTRHQCESAEGNSATIRTSQLDRNMDRPPRLDVTCRWVPGRKNCADRSLPIQAACQAGLATAGGKIRGHSHLHSQAIRGDHLHQLLSFVEALLPAKLLPVRLPPLAQDVALGHVHFHWRQRRDFGRHICGWRSVA